MPSRRAFVLLAAAAGLGALAAPIALPRLLRALRPPSGARREALVARLEALADRLQRGEIDAARFIDDVHARLADTDLPAALDDRLAAAPDGDLVEGVWRQQVGPQTRQMMLFFIRPGHAHPPHAHHDVASAQCAVRGRIHARQYERVGRRDPRTLALRPIADAVLRPFEAILTTERRANVHWFGAVEAPAAVFNYSLNGGLSDLFDAPGSRPIGRYFVDPTVAPADGLILAPELDKATAVARFAGRPLAAFPAGT